MLLIYLLDMQDQMISEIREKKKMSENMKKCVRKIWNEKKKKYINGHTLPDSISTAQLGSIGVPITVPSWVLLEQNGFSCAI